jgi:predicted alpha/beta superfamily hydrolase
MDHPGSGIGDVMAMRSAVLGEGRECWVYLPPSYASSTQAYPVLYLLDPETHFHWVTGLVAFLSARANRRIPELIVVGVANVDRTRDMTPTHIEIHSDGERYGFLKNSGGAAAFLAFITDELFHQVDQTYRTSSHRLLAGHSFGGVFALYALLESCPFQSTVALDPAIEWDDDLLVARAEQPAALRDRCGALYIAVAADAKSAAGVPLMSLTANRRFAAALAAAAPPGLRHAVCEFPSDDHSSVPLPGLHQGLLHVFKGYCANA